MPSALVTGSASGLGAAIATRLRADGWRVIGADIHEAEITVDLGRIPGREAMVEQAHALLGEDPLDAVVACAGVGPHVRPASIISSVNYFGATATLEGLRTLLERSDRAAAVAISSNSIGLVPHDAAFHDACVANDEEAAGSIAVRTDGAVVYGMAKMALARWVRRQATLWGTLDIRLNAVCPGPVETPLLDATLAHKDYGPAMEGLPIPLGRHGRPDDVAKAVAFLLSDDSSWIQGSVLFIDGGIDAVFRPDHA